jgi:aerobic-type carbon monoxide dehydrogenase small subunit (CoxS/CutS family)
MKILLNINGLNREVEANPTEKLRDLLQREGFVAVRNGCDGEGTCGNCSVLLNGRLVNSCLLLAAQVEGKKIHTIEHYSQMRELNPIQEAFIESGVVQCGYCTPAMQLGVHELLERSPDQRRPIGYHLPLYGIRTDLPSH